MMTIPIRFYAYGAVVALVLGAYFYWHHHVFTQGQAEQKAVLMAYKAGQAQAVAEYQSKLEAAQKAATAVTEAGNAKVDASNEANHETVRTITKIIHDNPSPVSCRLQPDSLRLITNAIRDANATTPH